MMSEMEKSHRPWKGERSLYAGPLFIHQLSHVWVDFRAIQDKYMGGNSID